MSEPVHCKHCKRQLIAEEIGRWPGKKRRICTTCSMDHYMETFDPMAQYAKHRKPAEHGQAETDRADRSLSAAQKMMKLSDDTSPLISDRAWLALCDKKMGRISW